MIFGKYFNKYYFKYGWYFLFGILALILVNYYQLEIPEVIGQIVDGLEVKTLTKEVLLDLSTRIFIVAFIVFVGRFVWRICIFGNGIRIETDLRNEMFSHMIKLSQEKYSKTKTGAMMALYTNDLNMIRQCFGGAVIMAVDAVVLGFLSFYKMIKLDLKLAVISLVPLLIVLVFSRVIGKIIRKKVLANLKAYSDMSDFVQEDFMGISVVKAFVKEKIKLKIFRKHNQNNMDTTVKIVKNDAFLNVLISSILATVNALIILFGGLYVFRAQTDFSIEFTVGNLTEFSSYFGTLVWPIMAIGQLINMKSQGQASAERITNLLDEEVEINDDLAISDVELKGNIKINHLCFKYPETNNLVLDDVCLDIKAGELVGLMGNTGSGKTTLVDLLIRMYNVKENKILFDDVDILNVPLKTLRESIAYVSQESFLFKDTIANNICFSLKETDKDLAKKYAILSDVDKDIVTFVDGYDTYVGERGVTVSGGQKQRISIARAFLKESPILIMDDSLSAVDIITEEAILKQIRELRKGKTTILIAHRISTLRTLDKIIVLDRGRVDGVGTHEELLATNEIYKREVELQELEKEEGEE